MDQYKGMILLGMSAVFTIIAISVGFIVSMVK